MNVIETVYIGLGLETSALQSGMRNALKDFDAFGEGIRNIGIGMTAMFTAPLALMTKSILDTTTEFEKATNRVNALIDGVTASQMASLEKLAIQLGQDTIFSAKQAAEAMGEFAAAGFNASQIADAMPGALGLAATSQLALAETAKIAAGVLGGFGLEASRMGHVADVLSKAANMSAIELKDLGYTMKYVAPVARAVGLSFEEITAATVIMGNQFIRGEQAGTGLRASILRLVAPTKENAAALKRLGVEVFDSTGQMKHFADIIDALNAKHVTAAQVSKLFGIESTTAMQALLSEGGDALRKVTAELEKVERYAELTARKMREGLPGAAEQLRGSMETLQVSLGKVIEPVALLAMQFGTNLLNSLGNAADAFRSLPGPVQVTAGALLAVLAVIGPLTVAFGVLFQVMGGTGGIAAAAASFGALQTAISNIAYAISTGMTGALVGVEAALLSVATAAAMWLGGLAALAGAIYVGSNLWADYASNVKEGENTVAGIDKAFRTAGDEAEEMSRRVAGSTAEWIQKLEAAERSASAVKDKNSQQTKDWADATVDSFAAAGRAEEAYFTALRNDAETKGSAAVGFFKMLSGELRRVEKEMTDFTLKLTASRQAAIGKIVDEKGNAVGSALDKASTMDPGTRRAVLLKEDNDRLELEMKRRHIIMTQGSRTLEEYNTLLKKRVEEENNTRVAAIKNFRENNNQMESEAKRLQKRLEGMDKDFAYFLANLQARQEKAAQSTTTQAPTTPLVENALRDWKQYDAALKQFHASNQAWEKNLESVREQMAKTGEDIKVTRLINSGEWTKVLEDIQKRIEATGKQIETSTDKAIVPSLKKQMVELKALQAQYQLFTRALAPEIMMADFLKISASIDPITGELIKAGQKARDLGADLKDMGKNAYFIKDGFIAVNAELNRAVEEGKKFYDTSIITEHSLQKQIEAIQARLVHAQESNAIEAETLQIQHQLLGVQIQLKQLKGEDVKVEKELYDQQAKRLQQFGIMAKTTEETRKREREFYREVRNIYNSMISSMADAIVTSKNLGEVIAGSFEAIQKAFVRMVLHGVFDQFKNAFMDAAKQGEGFRDIMTGIANKIGDAFKKLFGLFASGGKTIKNAGEGILKSVSGDKAAGGLSGAASGGIDGLMGTIGSLSSLVSGIFDVLGYFQSRRMEKDIGRIEVTSREIKADQQNAIAIYNKYFPYLENLALLQTVHADLLAILGNVEFMAKNGMGGRGSDQPLTGSQQFAENYARHMEGIMEQIKQAAAAGANQQAVTEAVEAVKALANLSTMSPEAQAAAIAKAVAAMQKVQGGSMSAEQLLSAMGLKTSLDLANTALDGNTAALEINSNGLKIMVPLQNRVNEGMDNQAGALDTLGSSTANLTTVSEEAAKNLAELSKTLMTATDEQRSAMLANLNLAELTKLQELNSQNLSALQDAFKKAAENANTSAEELNKFVFAVRDAQKGIWETNQRWREEMEKQTGKKINVAGAGNNMVTDPNMIVEYLRNQIDGLVAGKISMSIGELKDLRTRARQYGVVTDELDRLIASMEGVSRAVEGSGGTTSALEGAATGARNAGMSFGEADNAVTGFTGALQQSTAAVQANAQATLGAAMAIEQGSIAWMLASETAMQDLDALKAAYVQNPTQEILDRLNQAIANAAGKQSAYNPPGFMTTGGTQTYNGNVMAWEPFPGYYGQSGNQYQITINANNAAQGRQLADSFVNGLREKGVEI